MYCILYCAAAQQMVLSEPFFSIAADFQFYILRTISRNQAVCMTSLVFHNHLMAIGGFSNNKQEVS